MGGYESYYIYKINFSFKNIRLSHNGVLYTESSESLKWRIHVKKKYEFSSCIH